MSEILESLQRMTQNTVKAMDLLESRYATVVSTAPLTLSIQKSNFMVVEPVAEMTDAVRYREVIIEGQTIVINPGLVPGDKVLCLKADAGQKYIIIGKV